MVSTTAMSRDKIEDTKASLIQMAMGQAEYVKALRSSVKSEIEALARNNVFIDASAGLNSKIILCTQEAEKNNYLYYGLADLSGKATILKGSGSSQDVTIWFLQRGEADTFLRTCFTLTVSTGRCGATISRGGVITGVLYGVKSGLARTMRLRILSTRKRDTPHSQQRGLYGGAPERGAGTGSG